MTSRQGKLTSTCKELLLIVRTHHLAKPVLWINKNAKIVIGRAGG